MKAKDNLQELIDLEKVQNDGHGVHCVREVIRYIQKDDIESACRMRVWDGDKMRCYPDIEKWLDSNLCNWKGEPIE